MIVVQNPSSVPTITGGTDAPVFSSSVLITAGGTGGHVIPAYVLFQALQQQAQPDEHIHFVIDARARAFVDSTSESITVIPLPRYQGSLWQQIKFMWALLPSIYQCWRLIRKHNITTVVGFGGYITVPALIAAVLARCRIILHEQNVVLGRVNRVFGYVARYIILSTRAVHKYTQKLLNKCVTLGLPVRPEIIQRRYQLSDVYGPESPRLQLLIIGGSQAAAYFSDIIPKTLALLPTSLRDRLQIHQQCRAQDMDELQKIYQQLNVPAILKTFFDDMSDELDQAHLVFARAGASTIAEIHLMGKPAFLIPYPYAMDDHQTENAKLAARFGHIWWQPQSQLTPELLCQFLQYIIENPQILLLTSESARGQGYPQATKQLVYLIKHDQLLY